MQPLDAGFSSDADGGPGSEAMRQPKTTCALLLLAYGAAVAAQSGGGRSAPGPASQPPKAGAGLPQLRVHADKRYLIHQDGTPFLYLSDTAWELFHRPTREQVRQYLELRAKQRFTVVHAVALA